MQVKHLVSYFLAIEHIHMDLLNPLYPFRPWTSYLTLSTCIHTSIHIAIDILYQTTYPNLPPTTITLHNKLTTDKKNPSPLENHPPLRRMDNNTIQLLLDHHNPHPNLHSPRTGLRNLRPNSPGPLPQNHALHSHRPRIRPSTPALQSRDQRPKPTSQIQGR